MKDNENPWYHSGFYFISAKTGQHIPNGGALFLIHKEMLTYDHCVADAAGLAAICGELKAIAQDFRRKHTKGKCIDVSLAVGLDEAYIHAGRITYTCIGVKNLPRK